MASEQSEAMGGAAASNREGSGSASMGLRAAGSAAWVGAAQIFRMGMNLISTILVARLLQPTDYGVIAMAAPVMAFIILFQDLGLSQSVIQARQISAVALNGLFWINVGISVCISLILLILAPLTVIFYGDVRVGYITAASALAVLVNGVALQHSALLARDMRFSALSAVDVGNALATFLVTVVAALLIKSYWALWLGAMAGVLCQTLLLWSINRWRPMLPVSFAGTSEMVRFGGGVTGYNIFNALMRNLDNILIARFSGVRALGLYDQSYKLMMAPMQAINAPLTRVMMPVLSRLQDEDERYRRAFLLALRAMLILLTPGLAVAASMSDRVIPFLLGERWAAASPIFFWLSLAGLIQPVGSALGWLFLSSGRTTPLFHWGIFSALTTAIGFVIGLRWGAEGVAAGFFWSMALRLPLMIAWSVRQTSLKGRDIYVAMFEVTIGGGAAALTVHLLTPALSTFWSLVVCIPGAYFLTLVAHLSTKNGQVFIFSALNLARDLGSSRFPKLFLRSFPKSKI